MKLVDLLLLILSCDELAGVEEASARGTRSARAASRAEDGEDDGPAPLVDEEEEEDEDEQDERRRSCTNAERVYARPRMSVE